jgi:hypothetical protein
VTDAFAVEVDIALLGHANVVQFRHDEALAASGGLRGSDRMGSEPSALAAYTVEHCMELADIA